MSGNSEYRTTLGPDEKFSEVFGFLRNLKTKKLEEKKSGPI